LLLARWVLSTHLHGIRIILVRRLAAEHDILTRADKAGVVLHADDVGAECDV
jgi:hypothetical protein